MDLNYNPQLIQKFYKMRHFYFFLLTYFLILILSQYIFFDLFNTYHADNFYYLEQVEKYRLEFNFLEVLIKIVSFSPDINLPLIFFFTFFFKITDSKIIILVINTFFTLFIYIKINKILSSFRFEKILFIEFLILTSFLTYLNVGINKEIISLLALLHILHELIRISQKKITNTNLLKLFIFVFLFSLIKPLHAVFLISLIFTFLVIIYLIQKKQNILIVVIIFSILFIVLANLVNLRYSDDIPYFNFLNSYQYINGNRSTFFHTGLTHPTLEYLNRTDYVLEFEGYLFNSYNLSIIFNGFINSIIFPTFNDIIFAINQPSRFILFILFDSLLVKVGICFVIYSLFKKKNLSSNVIILILLVVFSLILSVNVPNDGINYRYLYPYKFVFIFLGYSQLKIIFKNSW